MSFKVQVGPPQIAIHHASAVLVTEANGEMRWPSDKGLYLNDTRLISAWSVQANGEDWDLINGGAVRHSTARVYLTNRQFLTEDGPITPRSLALVLSRHIEGGMHEDLEITNHSRAAVRFNLEVVVRCDFADVFDVKDQRNVRRGRINSTWSENQTLTTTYRNKDFLRAVMIAVRPAKLRACVREWPDQFRSPNSAPARAGVRACCIPSPPESRPSRLRTPTPLKTRRRRHGGDSILTVQDQQRRVLSDVSAGGRRYGRAAPAGGGHDDHEFIPAAGLPWFMAPFGRDSLIASLQNMIVWPDFAKGALDVLGHWQAKSRDPWRDAEPGKIMHELRRGELAHFHLIRHTPYYGTADATPLYLIALHAAWKATGDRSLLERYLPNAKAALRWIDEEGDRDGDMFQEFEKRSEGGYENMCWKDAGDSVTWPDGTLARGPKALCELQGYVYDAWRRMAEVFEVLGDPSAPRRYAKRRAPCSISSTPFSGMRTWAFTPISWTAKSGRCQQLPPTPATCCGRRSCRRTARAASSPV